MNITESILETISHLDEDFGCEMCKNAPADGVLTVVCVKDQNMLCTKCYTTWHDQVSAKPRGLCWYCLNYIDNLDEHYPWLPL